MLLATKTDHKSSVTSLALSNDEKFMISGSSDGVIYVWLTLNWTRLCQLAHDDMLTDIFDICIGKDDLFMMATDSYGVIARWQIKTDDFEKSAINLKIDQDQIKSAIISTDTKHLAAITQAGIILWDINTEEIIQFSNYFENHSQKGVKFSYNSDCLFLCQTKSKIIKWNLANQQVENSYLLPDETSEILCFTIESGDNYLYAVTGNSEIIVFNIDEQDKEA